METDVSGMGEVVGDEIAWFDGDTVTEAEKLAQGVR